MAVIPPCPEHHRELVDEKWCLAVDLGQSQDPTAIAVLQHRGVRHQRFDGRIFPSGEETLVRYLARLPLGLAYPEQAAEVGRLLQRPPLNRPGVELVLDATGVGRAVSDIFIYAGMKPTQVTITAGDTVTPTGGNRWNVSKGQLISLLDARLHLGELRIASALTEAGALASELRDFRRKVSAAGRFTYEARVGQHDDLVLAVAIGLWTLVGRPRSCPASAGRYVSHPGPSAATSPLSIRAAANSNGRPSQ
jgi:hypothetical protein